MVHQRLAGFALSHEEALNDIMLVKKIEGEMGIKKVGRKYYIYRKGKDTRKP
jgi:hypothetical protein